MTSVLESWQRQYFQQAGGKPYLHYVIFGALPAFPAVSPTEYRYAGLGHAIKVYKYDDSKPEKMRALRGGALWGRLVREHATLAHEIESAPECWEMKGELDDANNLNYLRDTVGMITYLLDNGGCAVQDPQIDYWWSANEWRQKIFSPAGPIQRNHITVSTSPDSSGAPYSWIHTRGMRKFGRPDLSIHRVPSDYVPAMIELCNRFVEILALGAIFQPGQEIRVKNLAAPLVCHPQGALDDPEFGNVHVEITFPLS